MESTVANRLGRVNVMVRNRVSSYVHRMDYCDSQLYEPHCNTVYEILFILKGSVNFELEGEHVLMQENSGIVIEPLQFQVLSGNEDAYHRILLFFSLEMIPPAIQEAFAERIKRYYVFSSPAMIDLFHQYAELVEKKDDTYQALKDALFTQIAYTIALDGSIEKKLRMNVKTEKLRQIIDYIDRNINTDIRVEDIADEMHMSLSTAYRLFKEEMHISLKQYIMQKKMMCARSMLQQGMAPCDVAAAIGYRNYPSFYRMYVKIIGKPPCKSV